MGPENGKYDSEACVYVYHGSVLTLRSAGVFMKLML